MARVMCNSCRGEYDTVQRDGATYAHVCPPLAQHEIEAAIAAGTLKLDLRQQLALVQGQLVVARPNARNENPPSTKERDAGERKAEGLGVTAVVDAVADPKA